MSLFPLILFLYTMLGCDSAFQVPKDREDKIQTEGTEIRSEKKKKDETSPAKSVESQGKAVAAIEQMGGRVTFDENNLDNPVIEIDLKHKKVNDLDLKHLKGFSSLKKLRVSPKSYLCCKSVFERRINVGWFDPF